MKRTLLFIMCVLASITMWAQEDSNDFNKPVMTQTDYFYYYKGNKIPLTLNETRSLSVFLRIVVILPKESLQVPGPSIRYLTSILTSFLFLSQILTS